MNRARLVGPARLLLTTAVAAGLVAGATLSPGADAGAGPGVAADRASTQQPVSSAAVSCPGPELTGIDDVEDLEISPRIGAATAPLEVIAPVVPAGRGVLVSRSAGEVSNPLRSRGATATLSTTAGAASEVSSSGAMGPGLAAAQEWAAAREELRGLVTVPCVAPGSESWLLAGGGDAGRQERLVLTNTGANEVTVDVEAFGLRGPIVSPSGSTVVPARGRVALLADAVTGDERSPAIRVRANGGSVSAVLTDTWLDGSVPAGAETTVPTAEPSTRQVIPAAMVSGTASVRIAVPGSDQAVVSARFLGPDGASPLPGGGVVTVGGRSTGELAVPALPESMYAVELTSDVPVVASLFASWRKDEIRGDFLWAPSTEAADGLLGAAYPRSETPRRRLLSVVSTGAPAEARVTWRSQGRWSTRSLAIPQDSSAALDLGDAESVWVKRISGTGQVRASVGTMMGTVERLVSVAPLAPSPVTSPVSRVYPAPF